MQFQKKLIELNAIPIIIDLDTKENAKKIAALKKIIKRSNSILLTYQT